MELQKFYTECNQTGNCFPHIKLYDQELNDKGVIDSIKKCWDALEDDWKQSWHWAICKRSPRDTEDVNRAEKIKDQITQEIAQSAANVLSESLGQTPKDGMVHFGNGKGIKIVGMDEMDDVSTMIVLPLSLEPKSLVPNSKIIKCESCQQDCWISPASYSIWQSKDIEIKCVNCCVEKEGV